MADQFAQGMQLGANLWDRAQTQRRMVDQLNLQVADQVMRQKTADIQNQMQQFHLRDALEEKTNQESDAPAYYEYQKQANNFLTDTSPDAALPTPPQFKSKVYRNEAENIMRQLEGFSPRKAAMANAAMTKQLLVQNNNALHYQYNREVEDALATGDPAIATLIHEHAGKLTAENGMFNPQVLTELRTAMVPFRKAAADTKEATARRLATGSVTERVTGEQLKNLATLGLVNPNDPTQVSEAENYLLSKSKITTDDAKSISSSDTAIQGLKSAESLADKFVKKYGKDALNQVIGPLDAPISTLKAKYYQVTPEDLAEAKQIKREVAQVVNLYRKGIFGATLPPQEITEMEKVVPSDKNNDYFSAAKGFRQILERGIGVTISRNKYSPLIDLGLKKRYAPDIFVQETSVSAPQGKTTSGKAFVIEQLP